MMTNQLHPLARNYLRQLRHDAKVLPRQHNEELLADVTQHFNEALGPLDDEAKVRTVLDRLGPPAELVSSAAESTNTPYPASRWSNRETFALAALVSAELLTMLLWPVAALLWLVGLVSLGRSRWWTATQKAWGFVGLGTGFPVVTLILSSASAQECIESSTAVGAANTQCADSGLNAGNYLVIALLLGYLIFHVWTLWHLIRGGQSR